MTAFPKREHCIQSRRGLLDDGKIRQNSRQSSQRSVVRPVSGCELVRRSAAQQMSRLDMIQNESSQPTFTNSHAEMVVRRHSSYTVA